jgi:Uma2 family endonuclease
MGMPTSARHWTRDQVLALPDDGQRYELVSGELVVTPAPRGLHQRAVAALHLALHEWLTRHPVAHVLFSPADIILGEDEILQPDLFVYRTPNGAPLINWSDISELLLVIEVSSPSSGRYDRQLKRRRYQRAAVPEYWVVDLDARLVERWRPGDEQPEVIPDRLLWQPARGGPLMDLDVEEMMRALSA